MTINARDIMNSITSIDVEIRGKYMDELWASIWNELN
jgi:hypothetical protein